MMNANPKNKPQLPLVSVVMPVRNAAEFVSDAIESILNQSYRYFELIVVDDASTDGSWKHINRAAKAHPNKMKTIRLRTQLGHGGDSAANVGIMHAKGKYIARMDADDVALPERLELQVRYMQSHPECAVLGSNAHVINKAGEIVGEKITVSDHEDIYREYFVLHPMIHPTVILRRSSLDEGDHLYLTHNTTNNDYLTFFKMISQGKKFANLKQKLLYYRIHGKNDSLARVKRTFLNSLRTRYRAVRDFGYRPTPMAVVKLAAQSLIVLLLPEKLTFHIYLLTRGITRPADYLRLLRLPVFSWAKRVLNSVR